MRDDRLPTLRTAVIEGSLAFQMRRFAAAQANDCGLQILNLPQAAARLAGGFAIPASADLLEPAIREALDEGGFDELERVRHLPGMTRAVFRTLRKIWAADFDLSAPGPDGHRRIAEMSQIEARLKARLPPSAMTPRELRDAALKRVRHAPRIVGEIRYRMFVERQKWTVPSYKQLEYDEFDTPAATYILTVDEHYRTLGTMRLIPTTRPYMVESLWPGLVDTELPHCDSVWEASRFCCDRDLDAASRRQVVAQSILGCLEFGIANGISKYLGVMPIQIFKNVIAANQCPVDRAGPTLRQSGHDIAAAYIDVSPSILEAVRRHTGIRSAVLETE